MYRQPARTRRALTAQPDTDPPPRGARDLRQPSLDIA